MTVPTWKALPAATRALLPYLLQEAQGTCPALTSLPSGNWTLLVSPQIWWAHWENLICQLGYKGLGNRDCICWSLEPHVGDYSGGGGGQRRPMGGLTDYLHLGCPAGKESGTSLSTPKILSFFPLSESWKGREKRAQGMINQSPVVPCLARGAGQREHVCLFFLFLSRFLLLSPSLPPTCSEW